MVKKDKAKKNLGEFEGKPVIAVGVEMPSAAGGLQEAMKFDPVEWHQGDEGHIVLSYTVQKVRFEPIDKDNPGGAQRRVHVLKVSEAAPIESEDVEEALAAQRERIEIAKEKEAGTQRIPFDGDQDQVKEDDDEGNPDDPEGDDPEASDEDDDDDDEIVDEEEDETGYKEWSHKELQAECKDRKIPANGSKEELAARLLAHDAGAGESPARGSLKSV